jgi:hypothetical protein
MMVLVKRGITGSGLFHFTEILRPQIWCGRGGWELISPKFKLVDMAPETGTRTAPSVPIVINFH